MNIPLDLIVYIAALGGLYFYSEKRNSSGFFWVCCYVASHWLIHEGVGYGVLETAIAAAVGLAAILELTRYFWDDPFSTPSLINYFKWILSGIKKFIKVVGIQPKSSIYDLKSSPDTLQIKKYLIENRWNEAENFLKKFNTDERFAIIDSLVDEEGRTTLYDEWISQRPHSAMAWLVSGFQFIHWAWEARGGGTADTVTQNGYRKFFSRLNDAHEAFSRSIELDKKYADPYVGLMTIAMGTGYERERLWDYFAKALVRSKHCYSAYRQMIHALSEKWGGEPGEMLSIASRAAGNAENNIPLAGILAEAHIEQWLYMGMCGQDAQAEIYFREPQVRQDLLDAYNKIRGAEVSSFHMTQALNNFAFCFYLGGMNDLAKDAVTKLGGKFHEHPWDYLNESIMSLLDTGYTLDEVIKKLEVESKDLPDVIVKNKLPTSLQPESDGKATIINTPEDYFNRRLFKTSVAVPLSIAMVLIIMLGYPIVEIFHKKVGLLESFKPITLEIFIVCQIGLCSLVLLTKKQLKMFLYRYPIIESREALEAFKPVARTNMYAALLAFLFLGIGTLAGIMTLINHGLWIRIVVVIFFIATSTMFAYYNALEEKIKQIECNDEDLEVEFRKILECWLHRAFPNF